MTWELAEWYAAAGLPGAADMVRSQGQITDERTFRAYWPTSAHSFDWRTGLVSQSLTQAAGAADSTNHGAAGALAGNFPGGVDNVRVRRRRPRPTGTTGTSALSQTAPPGTPASSAATPRGLEDQ